MQQTVAMTPGTIILLHSPLATTQTWGSLPAALRSAGCSVIAPQIDGDPGIRYVGEAALAITAAGVEPPLVLVALGAAGPLLPLIGGAQRAAHRLVGGYALVDADLPPARNDGSVFYDSDSSTRLPNPPDWPDAPCGYLATTDEHREQSRQAEMRGWTVGAKAALTAESLRSLIRAL